ncbi:NAD(P)H nitroreductase [uncultured Paraglaciecola sp.]|uniref:NAD(P)H nitroreductase n=1 Tax=uncultured Paraglaciecola sp. TaxID=1765024 RepID=UPI0025F9FAFE|nr:NAD(P)H nitroreductase [uncultured Paraglaciecola sp.]
MQALDLLLNRSSQPRLQAPAPEGEVLENIKQAALRAPDHACLAPWKFIVCQNQGLTRLGKVFEQAAIAANKSEKEIDRAPQLPLRAPMVMVAVAKYTEHDKVPWVEQVASASCAVHAMQMAAVAQGFAGVWRTGSFAQDPNVKQAFDLAEQDEIVGFLYLGSTAVQPLPKPKRDSAAFFENWD